MGETVLNPKIESTSGFFDALLLGGMKTVSERVIAKTPVGNATFLSGVVKLFGSGLVHGVSKNKYAKLFGSALGVDAMEDLATAMLKMVGVGGSNGVSGGGEDTTDNW